MRYYLDEDQPLRAALIARTLGLDVVATEECARKGTSDESQLEFAAHDGRVLVTQNFGDFDRLTRQFLAEGRVHAGVLMVSTSLQSNDFAGLARALLAFDRGRPYGMPAYAIDYLRRP